MWRLPAARLRLLRLARGAALGQRLAARLLCGRELFALLALLLAAADMLDHLGMVAKGTRLRAAISDVMNARDRTTPDVGGTGTTDTFGDAIVERIKAAA